MLQNPRSAVQQVADILGMIVDLKMSTQTLRGLRSATKTQSQFGSIVPFHWVCVVLRRTFQPCML